MRIKQGHQRFNVLLYIYALTLLFEVAMIRSESCRRSLVPFRTIVVHGPRSSHKQKQDVLPKLLRRTGQASIKSDLILVVGAQQMLSCIIG